MSDPIDPALEGVPETLLWTLYHRALEARRPDAVLSDPVAGDLVDRIDYPFCGALRRGVARRVAGAARPRLRPRGPAVPACTPRRHGGRPRRGPRDPVRAGRRRPGALDRRGPAGDRRSAPAAAPRPPRRTTIARSALDPAWLAEVGVSRGALLNAQGLLMYLEPAAVHRLLERVAARFPGEELVFDAVPAWLAKQAQRVPARGPGAYRPRPWTWTLDRAEAHRDRGGRRGRRPPPDPPPARPRRRPRLPPAARDATGRRTHRIAERLGGLVPYRLTRTQHWPRFRLHRGPPYSAPRGVGSQRSRRTREASCIR
jgi:O-methyltransferase involved in polyketide biosynthesis